MKNANQKRMKQTELEIMEVYKERAKRIERMSEPSFVSAEFWDDKNNTFLNGAQFELPKGKISINKWIEENGFCKCNKSDATSLLIVGEKLDGCFLIGKSKNYWLK